MTNPSKQALKPSNYSNQINFDALIDSNIRKPAQYIGNELGVEPHNWEKAKIRWALTYPELYEIGISNSGHIILYSILNSLPGQICDRAYLPESDLAQRLRQLSQP